MCHPVLLLLRPPHCTANRSLLPITTAIHNAAATCVKQRCRPEAAANPSTAQQPAGPRKLAVQRIQRHLQHLQSRAMRCLHVSGTAALLDNFAQTTWRGPLLVHPGTATTAPSTPRCHTTPDRFSRPWARGGRRRVGSASIKR